MFVVPKDASAELPVILRDDDDYASAKTGIAFGAVTLKFRKWPAVAWTTDTIDSGNWTEVGDGHYTWDATSSDLNTAGLFFYIVQAADCVQYEGSVYVSTNDFDDLATDIAALNDPAASAIADAVWDEVAAGHTDAGSFGKYLDQQISVTESNIRGADSDDLKDISDEIAGLSIPTAAAIADAVWDEAAAGHTGAGSFGEGMDTLTTRIDQALSTMEDNIRGTDNDDLKDISDEIAALSIPTALAVADAVWDEAAAGHTGAGSFGEAIDTLTTNIDVVLSTRSSHSAADVDTELSGMHGGGSWESALPPSAAAIADAVWDEAAADHTGVGSFGEAIDTLTTNIDAVLSTRSSHSAADVDTVLAASHGAGSWEGGGAAPTAAAIADAVLEELIADHSSVSGSLADVIDEIHSYHLSPRGHAEFE